MRHPFTYKKWVLIFFSCFITVSGIRANVHDKGDPYKTGLIQIDSGDWESALNYWIGVRDSLQLLGETDFRIGQKFIETVTQHERRDLYPLASEFYMWGLQSQNMEPIRSSLINDIEMMRPILPESLYHSWLSMVRNYNPEIFSEMRGYWILNNPVQDTALNERLIEHWERIAYVRSNFRINNSTVYGGDERSIIYVKLGEPDKIESGTFLSNNNHIQFVAREILRQQEEEVDSFGQDVMQRLDDSVQGMAMNSYYMNNLAKNITDRVLSERISSNFMVWVYNRFDMGIPENLIYIFGKDASTGSFGLIRSPEQFIPSSAFRPVQVRGSNFRFNMGPILQMSIYNDLRFVDDKFMDIYNELADRLLSDESIISESSTSYLMYKFADELEAMRDAAPEHFSIYDRELITFPISSKSYQFFDQSLRPYHLLVAFSEPHESILIDNARFTNHFEGEDPRYYLKHMLTIYDSDWNRIERLQDFPAVTFEEDESTNQRLPSSSIFRIPYFENEAYIHLAGSVINESLHQMQYPQSRTRDQIISPEYIIGNGFTEVDLHSGIHALESNQFWASDLILGYRSDFELDEELFIPFFIPKNHILSRSVDLYFMLEVYNIPMAESGLYEFNLEYQVIPQEERSVLSRIFRRSLTSEQQINLTIESEEDRSRNTISVDISDYVPGKYTLRISLSTRSSEREIIREVDFEIAS